MSDIQVPRDSSISKKTKKSRPSSLATSPSQVIQASNELDAGLNWKEVGQSTSSELGQMWISICSFLMNLPMHITNLWENISQFFYGWMYVLYGKWFERMMADQLLARRHNLDVLWLRLVKLTPDVRSYCLIEAKLTCKKAPNTLLDLIELVRQNNGSNLSPLDLLIDDIEQHQTGQLWEQLSIIRERNIETDGKLAVFISAIRPWSFETMLSVVASQSVNVGGMLQRIEKIGLHIYT
jgi:hypothetical protein